jgi:aspartyl-tRNA(Asn)/glutamyl-tRNA(Gln) amidotransferase subunit C
MAAAEIDIKYVAHLAHLARIALTPDEGKKLAAQLGGILSYIEKLKELDVTNVEPTAHAVPMVNVTRADEIKPSLPHEEAMLNAPKQANGLFIVPKIVE